MELYNKNKKQTENISYIEYNKVIRYVDKLSEDELRILGYYKRVFLEKPNERYYTAKEENKFEGYSYITFYTKKEKPLEELKDNMLKDMSDSFKHHTKRPKILTSLGYYVDGGKEDVKNLELGKKYNFTQIKDANNCLHDITTKEYNIIVSEIEKYNIFLLKKKWEKETSINKLKNVTSCIHFEHTPYEFEEIEIIEEEEIIKKVTKYINNTIEW